MSENKHKLSLVLDMVDNLTAPIQKVTTHTTKAGEKIKATQDSLKKLGQQSSDIEHFRKLKTATAQTSKELEEAQTKANRLAQQMQNTAKPTRKMTAEFNKAQTAVSQLKTQHQGETEQLQKLRGKLSAAGISTTRLNEATRKIKKETQAYNEQLQREQGNLEKIAQRQEKLAAIRESSGSVSGAIAGVAGGVSVVGLSDPAMQAQKAGAQLAAMQGEGRGSAEKYRDMISQIYGSTTYSLEQTTEAISAVTSSLGGLGKASSQSIVSLTQNAAAINQAYGIAATESMQAASQLVKNGLVKNTTEAFDLISGGLQQMSASMRGEMPEILNEYGVHFKSMGFSGDEAMRMLVDASKSGKIALDKTGDAIKEFTLRGSDMSKSSVEAYERIGLSANDMANAIVSGGPAARDALMQTAKGLLAIDDPAERANAAIALFGTPLEDLSIDKIPEFLKAMSGAGAGMGDLSGATDALSKTLNGNGASSIQLVGKALMGSMMKVFNDLEPQIIAVTSVISDFINNNPKIVTTVAAITASVAALAAIGGITSLVITAFSGLGAILTTVKLTTSLLSLEQMKLSASLLLTKIRTLTAAIAVGVMSGAQKALALATAFTTSATVRANAAMVLTHTRTVAAAGALLMMSGVQKALAAGTAVMTGAQWALNTAMMANPIGLVIAGVMALIAVVALVIKYWEPITGFFSNMWGGIKTVFSGAWDGIKNTLTMGWEFIKTLFAWSPLGLIIQAWEPITGFFGSMWEGIKGMFSGAMDWITSMVLAPIETLKNTLGAAWSALFGSDGEEITHTVKKVAQDVPAVSSNSVAANATQQQEQLKVAQTETLPAAGNRTVVTSNPVYEFNIHAAPGMDEKAIAQEIKKELDRRERALERRARTMAID